MIIRPIVKSYYSNQEIEALSKSFIEAIAKVQGEQAIVQALGEKLSAAHEAIKEASLNSNHNSKTALVQEADRVRDLAFRAFYDLIEAGILRQNEAHRIACTKIMSYLERVDKRLYSYGYTKESIELRKLFDEMENVKDEIDLVSARDWLSELKSAEEAFSILQQEKLNEETETRIVIRTKEAKDQALDQLINVVNTLNGLASIGIAGVAELNAQLDSIVAAIEGPAKARLSRRENQSVEISE
ncbi:hypothetical protein KO507_02960 [Gilvimarinus agarilyticus]|uniref:DUF6261 family protein n=1 Tax=Reichenbachiella agariperforans TaxID=156994 RepID=UPI001C096AA6|nr:DUF6261 family protein [Reichenbachiella agariperforans]MBU2884720.1 hypothetical protein [Gilvimarinus agarilyticus]MBU2914958.1 hypothetical protein [Reichenbachiella agariperforans]